MSPLPFVLKSLPNFPAVFVAILAVSFSGPSIAQDGNDGIAFVQAPEQSSGVCTGPTAEAAFECAVNECVEGGAASEDCLKTHWCFPAGWSVDVFAQHKEGLHWHENACGLDSELTALNVGAAMCDMDSRPYLIECSVVLLYDPEGNQIEVFGEGQ